MLLVGAAALTSAVGGVTPAAADKITLMVGGIEKIVYLPAKLAENLGYFKDDDLTVELVSVRVAVEAEESLLAGEVQGVVGFYDHTIDLQAKGKAVESVVQLLQAPGDVVLVDARKADKIKSAADFKGKNLGVSGLGSSGQFLTQYLAVKNGVKISEFTSVAVGAGDTFIAAMKQGQIDAGMTTEPTVSRMLTTGDAKILIDMRCIRALSLNPPDARGPGARA